jgi:hypothetical protein
MLRVLLVLVASTALATADPETKAEPKSETKPIESWGAIEPGKGFLVGRTDFGELSISAYALIRYLNQLPAGQTFEDHIGRTHEVDPRHDIYAHRVMIHFKGWLATPKLRYQLTLWTVNTTDQRAIFAAERAVKLIAEALYGGLNALPGSRTLLGSHPYWLGHDRVMADEFFRPYFTYGVWATGEPMHGLWYAAMVGDNLSALGITAKQLTRAFAYGASVWWMPTTGEFGPNGSFDDYEHHERVATRVGISGTMSREDPFSDAATKAPENTTIRLADAINLFEPGSLAPGVSVLRASSRMFSVDAAVKYRGMFLGASYFQRWLGNFEADGQLPISSIVDRGFYVQAAFYPVPKKLELYGATSWVFGDKDAGFETSHEYLGGVNWFFAATRDLRLNAQLIRVDRSPVSSSFGYYIGGQKGETLSLAASVLF